MKAEMLDSSKENGCGTGRGGRGDKGGEKNVTDVGHSLTEAIDCSVDAVSLISDAEVLRASYVTIFKLLLLLRWWSDLWSPAFN